MKRRKRFVVIVIVILILLIMLGSAISLQSRNNSISKQLNALDPKKITGCMISWYSRDSNYESVHYEYIETNTEKIKEIYDALSHMKMDLKKNGYLVGAPYYGIYFFQDGEKHGICGFYASNYLLAPGKISDGIYGGEITNLEELNRKYNFTELISELIENAEIKNGTPGEGRIE